MEPSFVGTNVIVLPQDYTSVPPLNKHPAPQAQSTETAPQAKSTKEKKKREKGTSKGEYRACRKAFFLTYAQSGDLTRERVLEHLKTKGDVEKYLLATELHADGRPHIHVYIKYAEERDFTNARWADVDGHHPNDKGVIRNHHAVSHYCGTAGNEPNFLTNFYQLDPFKVALTTGTYEEALELIKNKRPRDYVLYSDRIESTLKKAKGPRPSPPDYKLSQFTMPALDLSKPVLLWGKSNSGKTQFALAHFNNPRVITHMDDLKHFDPRTHDGLVFDDLSFKHLPFSTILNLLDNEVDRSIHVRYGCAYIPKKTKKIFTHNTRDIFIPDVSLDVEQYTALERRYTSVEVNNKLY